MLGLGTVHSTCCVQVIPLRLVPDVGYNFFTVRLWFRTCCLFGKRFPSRLRLNAHLAEFLFLFRSEGNSGNHSLLHHIGKIIMVDMTHETVKLID